MKSKIILTCEHAGFKVPSYLKEIIPYKYLNSHYGYDQGALEICKILGATKYFYNTYSRLVADSNRNHKTNNVFSKFTKGLDQTLKNKILKDCYFPYRQAVQVELKNIKMPTYVFSVHSFTPTYKGKKRKTDIGILYRTHIKKEQKLAMALKRELQKLTGLNVHLNLPYRGHTDCFLNDLSDQNLKNKNFVGLFLEFNQKLLRNQKQIKKISHNLRQAMGAVIN